MVNPIASTVFRTGARDTLAAVDAYKTKGAGPGQVINSVQSMLKKAGLDTTGILSVGSMASLFGLKNGKVSLNADALVNRLVGSNGPLKGSLQTLTGDIKDKISTSFGEGLKIADKLSVKINGSSFPVDGSLFSEIKSYSSMVNDFTGKTGFMTLDDKSAIGSLTASIITEGSALGIPNLFSQVTSEINDSVILNQVVKGTIPGLVARGDVGSLFDMSGNPKIQKTIGILFPDFGKEVIRSYGALGSENPTMRTQSWTNLIGTLANVNANWDQFKRQNGNDTGISILSLLGASNDFKTLLKAGVSMYQASQYKEKTYGLAAVQREVTVAEMLRRDFPSLVLEITSKTPPQYGTKTMTSTKIVDPRIVTTAGKLLAGLLG